MSKYVQGTLEKRKRADGWTWFLRCTDNTGAKPRRTWERVGLVADLPTKGKARKAAEPILKRLNGDLAGQKTFGDLLDEYGKGIAADMTPEKAKELGIDYLSHSTRRGYRSMISKHIRPRWEKTPLAEVHSYETKVWILSLPIGTRRMGHIHGLMHVLFRHATHIRWLPQQTNPMENFKIPGSTKRKKTPGTITHLQFHELLEKIVDEPYRTMVIAAQCLGLRISELLALQWRDLDFLGARITITRAIVEQHVGAVKTYQSARQLPLHPHLSQLFLNWRKQTEFTQPEHYIFASPWQAGELPYNASKIQSKILRKAGQEIGLPFPLGWHTFRHSYRALLRQSGAPIDVQRDLMRHADIRTTMQTYGGTELDELRPVNQSVVDSLFGGGKQ